MTPPHSPAPLRSTDSSGACPRCGGSGILRVNDQSYRTCLDCLGQGLILSGPVEELVFRPIRPAHPAPATVPGRVAADLRASASAA